MTTWKLSRDWPELVAVVLSMTEPQSVHLKFVIEAGLGQQYSVLGFKLGSRSA